MQDNIYLSMLNRLLRLRTPDEVTHFFEIDQTGVDERVLQTIDAKIRPATDTHTAASLGDLKATVWRRLCKQCLVHFLCLGKEESVAYANENYTKLLTESNFQIFEELWRDFRGDDLDRWLLAEKQTLLVNAAVNWAISFMDWPAKRELYLSGLPWMTNDITRMILDDLAKQSEQHVRYVHGLRELISLCQEGDVTQVLLGYDIAYKTTLISKMSLTQKVHSLLQIFELSALLPHNHWVDILDELQKVLGLLKTGEWKSQELRSLTDRLLDAVIETFPGILARNPPEIDLQYGALIKMNLVVAFVQRLETRSNNPADAISAIDLLEELLVFYNQATMPVFWGKFKSLIGFVYAAKYGVGFSKDDLENSRAGFLQALQIFGQHQEEEEAGITWQRLGDLYLTKYKADKSENAFTEALAAFVQVLRIFPKERNLPAWAKAQSAIGSLHWHRLPDDKTSRPKAIDVFQEVLAATSLATTPGSWASAHYHLGLIYHDAGIREPGAMEASITSFTAALDFYTSKNHPLLWANVMYNLGASFLHRQTGEPEHNFEDAIEALTAALRVINPDNAPQTWAKINNNLGSAYRNRRQGVKAENIRAAIGFYEQTMTVVTREADPDSWAKLQHNLGNAFADEDLDGDRSANIESAILAFDRALEFRTRAQLSEWALTVNSRALLYTKRLQGNSEQNGQQALSDYLSVLEVLTIDTQPKLCRVVYYNLGLWYYDIRDWTVARKYFEESVKAVNVTRDHVALLDSRGFIAKETAASYACLIHCCLELGDMEAALVNNILRKGKTFSEQLLSNPAQENRKTETGVSPHLSGQPNSALTLYSILALQEELGKIPILEYTVHAGGWGVFVLDAGALHYVALADNFYAQLAETFTLLMLGEFWSIAGSEKRLRNIYSLVFEPVDTLIPRTGPLLISPAQSLHLIPFQSLVDQQQRYLADRYTLSLVPSLAALQVLHRRQDARSNKLSYKDLVNIAFVQETDEIYAEVRQEAESVASCFARSVTLFGEGAALPGVIWAMNRPGMEVIHLNCHGQFNFLDPSASGLILAQDTELTVREIISQVHFTNSPLVTLSACQSGIVKPVESDESIVLSWAFLVAGASGVLASLWLVNAQATRLLFTYFYEIRTTTRISHAAALRRAMFELRRLHPEYEHPEFWSGFHVIGVPEG